MQVLIKKSSADFPNIRESLRTTRKYYRLLQFAEHLVFLDGPSISL